MKMRKTNTKQVNGTIPTKKIKTYCELEDTPWFSSQEEHELSSRQDARSLSTQTLSRRYASTTLWTLSANHR